MRIESIVTVAAAVMLLTSSAGAYADTYNASNNQVTIPSVTAGATIYTNVVVTVGNIVSIGGSYPAGLTTFPVGGAVQALEASGLQSNFSVTLSSSSLYCSGSGTRTIAPATTPTSFNGVLALSSVTVITWTYSNCSPQTGSSISTSYYSSSYVPLGSTATGLYGIFLTPLTLPATVSIGGAGTIGSMYLYTDSSQATPNGRIDETYVIGAGTSATTAVISLIKSLYDAAGMLTTIETDSWLITTAGALTPISTNIQYKNGTYNNADLVWTYH